MFDKIDPRNKYFVHYHKAYSLICESKDEFCIYFRHKNIYAQDEKLIFSSDDYKESLNKFELIIDNINKNAHNLFLIKQFKKKIKKLGLKDWTDKNK